MADGCITSQRTRLQCASRAVTSALCEAFLSLSFLESMPFFMPSAAQFSVPTWSTTTMLNGCLNAATAPRTTGADVLCSALSSGPEKRTCKIVRVFSTACPRRGERRRRVDGRQVPVRAAARHHAPRAGRLPVPPQEGGARLRRAQGGLKWLRVGKRMKSSARPDGCLGSVVTVLGVAPRSCRDVFFFLAAMTRNEGFAGCCA